MNKDVLKILKDTPRDKKLRGFYSDPGVLQDVLDAMEYAASEEGQGLTRKDVYEALRAAGVIKIGYGYFSTYFRENRADLWARVKSR